MDIEDDHMLYISFNQDNSCFAVGTERGYRIYSLQTPNLDFYERVMDGGIGIIEMLFRSNILALVGGGKYPKYPQNKVIIWDDNNGKVITELSFNGYVNNVKLKRDKIVIICDKKIFVFNLMNLTQIDVIDYETIENKKGLIAITPLKGNSIAYPDKAIGYVRIKNYDIGKKVLINAHDNPLAAIAFSRDGTILASASCEGIYLRLFTVENANFIYQFQIGKYATDVLALSFDADGDYLITSIVGGVVCGFSMGKAKEKYEKGKMENNKDKKRDIVEEEAVSMPQQSIWSKMFTRDEGPFITMKVPEKKLLAAFVTGSYGKNRICVIGSEGRFYLARFDEKEGGIAMKEEERSLGINLYD